ncbi:isopentenyl-diphosphate Delta-isomerase [Streptomyces sp. PTD5-9]|uniref:isopentenyl-diphosphate Delta-isomerase n=1 Tax=Streptomyces sp. PTD5-9 TaxID=3120150 RepID=UPI0030099631
MPSSATRGQAARERLRVELVDPSGRTTGSTTVHAAHTRPDGLLHRAFSVMLVNGRGEVLLQRRAAAKRRFPGLWSNTCCGHPAPGQRPADAARARLLEELGVRAGELRPGRPFVYRAEDPASEYVEHEYDHVLVGDYDGVPPAVDPDEASEAVWRPLAEVLRELDGPGAASFTPWFRQVAERTRELWETRSLPGTGR